MNTRTFSELGQCACSFQLTARTQVIHIGPLLLKQERASLCARVEDHGLKEDPEATAGLL